MPQHYIQRALPFTPEQMFALVADIESYPAFLPWCLGARVIKESEEAVKADLIVGANAFQETFTSHVTFERPTRISVSYAGGPLSHLCNEWNFAPAPGGCALTFYVDFAFRSLLLAGMMGLFFERAFCKMSEAFEARALELYGVAG